MPVQPIEPPLPPAVPILEAIYCHRLADAGDFVAQESTLARKVFQVSAAGDGSFKVAIDGSGLDLTTPAIDFTSMSAAGVPGTAEEADSAVRDILASANRAADSAGITRALHARELLPSELALSCTSAVYDPTTQQLVQWLCQYQPLTSTGSSRGSVPVVDASLVIRIGHAKSVCRFAARWCPISASSLCSALPPPDIRDLPWSAAAQERAGYSAEGLDSGTSYTLCYARDESGGAAAWLVPYYVFAADPNLTRYPAAQVPGQ